MPQLTVTHPVILENSDLAQFFNHESPTPKKAKPLKACYQQVDVDDEGWPSGIHSVSPLLLAVQLESAPHIEACLPHFIGEWSNANKSSKKELLSFYKEQAEEVHLLNNPIIASSQAFKEMRAPKYPNDPYKWSFGDYIYQAHPALATFFSQAPNEVNVRHLEKKYLVEWSLSKTEYYVGLLDLILIALLLNKCDHALLIAKHPNFRGSLNDPLIKISINHFCQGYMDAQEAERFKKGLKELQLPIIESRPLTPHRNNFFVGSFPETGEQEFSPNNPGYQLGS